MFGENYFNDESHDFFNWTSCYLRFPSHVNLLLVVESFYCHIWDNQISNNSNNSPCSVTTNLSIQFEDSKNARRKANSKFHYFLDSIIKFMRIHQTKRSIFNHRRDKGVVRHGFISVKDYLLLVAPIDEYHCLHFLLLMKSEPREYTKYIPIHKFIELITPSSLSDLFNVVDTGKISRRDALDVLRQRFATQNHVMTHDKKQIMLFTQHNVDTTFLATAFDDLSTTEDDDIEKSRESKLERLYAPLVIAPMKKSKIITRRNLTKWFINNTKLRGDNLLVHLMKCDALLVPFKHVLMFFKDHKSLTLDINPNFSDLLAEKLYFYNMHTNKCGYQDKCGKYRDLGSIYRHNNHITVEFDDIFDTWSLNENRSTIERDFYHSVFAVLVAAPVRRETRGWAMDDDEEDRLDATSKHLPIMEAINHTSPFTQSCYLHAKMFIDNAIVLFQRHGLLPKTGITTCNIAGSEGCASVCLSYRKETNGCPMLNFPLREYNTDDFQGATLLINPFGIDIKFTAKNCGLNNVDGFVLKSYSMMLVGEACAYALSEDHSTNVITFIYVHIIPDIKSEFYQMDVKSRCGVRFQIDESTRRPQVVFNRTTAGNVNRIYEAHIVPYHCKVCSDQRDYDFRSSQYLYSYPFCDNCLMNTFNVSRRFVSDEIGFGLFARRNIDNGEIVFTQDATDNFFEIITGAELYRRYSSCDLFTPYCLDLAIDGMCLDQTCRRGVSSLLNCANCDENANCDIVMEVKLTEPRGIELKCVARKDIAANSELLLSRDDFVFHDSIAVCYNNVK